MILPKLEKDRTLRQNGKIMSITLELRDPEDVKRYRSFLTGEKFPIPCPHCGKNNNIGNDDHRVSISNPLISSALEAVTPVMRCDFCQKDIPLAAMLMLNDLPSVSTYVMTLRQRYQAQTRAKRGGSPNGQG